MAKIVLITGISGFIAKHVALEFLKAGYKVRGTVRTRSKGDKARKAPKLELPNFAVKLIGLFDPSARSIVHEPGLDRKMDNSRTKKALGIEFIPAGEAAIASARSLIELDLV